MDTEDKYLSGEGLSYFTSVADAHIVRSLEEITDPGYSNETDIIVLWGAGERIKCVAPDEIGFDTKMIYLGTNIYYDNPKSITVNSGTTQTVVFGENNEYTMIRTRNSSSEPWPNTFYTLNSDSLWDESAKRTRRAIRFYRDNTTYNGTPTYAKGGGNLIGMVSPAAWLVGTTGVKCYYGY